MVRLRLATIEDARYLLFLRNERMAVKNSILSPRKITYKEHLKWLKSRLPDTVIFIIEKDGKRVGDVRLQDLNSKPEIGIRIAPKYRNKGIATKAIRLATELSPKPVVAMIKVDNVASIKAFKKVGYKKEGLWNMKK